MNPRALRPLPPATRCAAASRLTPVTCSGIAAFASRSPYAERVESNWTGQIIVGRGGLPSARAPIFGRASEIAAVARYLTDGATRLLTLVGPPGVGKSRLGIAAAHDLVTG